MNPRRIGLLLFAMTLAVPWGAATAAAPEEYEAQVLADLDAAIAERAALDATGALTPVPAIATQPIPQPRPSVTNCSSLVIQLVCASALYVPEVVCQRYSGGGGTRRGVFCVGGAGGGGGGGSGIPVLGSGSADWKLSSSCNNDCSNAASKTGTCSWSGSSACASGGAVAHPNVSREAWAWQRVCVTYGVSGDTTTTARNLFSVSARDAHTAGPQTLCNI